MLYVIRKATTEISFWILRLYRPRWRGTASVEESNDCNDYNDYRNPNESLQRDPSVAIS